MSMLATNRNKTNQSIPGSSQQSSYRRANRVPVAAKLVEGSMEARGVAAVAVLLLLVLVLVPEACRAERFVVGDTARWTWGYNYTDWVAKKGPFFQNDSLVFRYDPPNATTHAHSVYMMRNLADYQSCNLNASKLVAGVMQGAGSGFEFVLQKRKVHYFVCGERGGLHCTAGQMKFIVKPKRSVCRDD